MGKQENLVALEKFAEAVNAGEFDLFDEAVAPECVDHDPAPGQEPGPQGYRALFSGMREGFPDMHVALETMVADDESVAFAYTFTGTHTGQFMGIAPTGGRVHFRGLQISKFHNGKMSERWGSSDQLGMLQQMNITTLPSKWAESTA